MASERIQRQIDRLLDEAEEALRFPYEEPETRPPDDAQRREKEPKPNSLGRLITIAPLAGRRSAGGVSYSSSVVISPGSRPSSLAFSSRRIILPERVLGSVGVKSISEGTAMGPSSRLTCC